jgi:succinate-semialdehyde dehydrogenase/glutarate-semialdehyde dehydrogenase
MTMMMDSPLLIDGRWIPGISSADVLDKYRLAPCGTVQIPSREQVLECVAGANAAYRSNRLAAHDRAAILERAAASMERRREELIAVLQAEAGFTQADASGEFDRCIQTFRLSADEARRFCGELVPLEGAPKQEGRIGFTLRVPLGVVCAITPFNAPLNTVAHKVAPALAAGNAVVLKPSPHTPRSACIMAQALIEAGLPRGLISVIHGGPEVVQWLMDQPEIRFFAFTGSTEVGETIQRRAGLRRTQMELGSIAFSILNHDADLDAALPKVINAAYRKAGQVCTSIQVLLVHSSIMPDVQRRLAAMVGELQYGDPRVEGTVVGPVISEAAARRIAGWIDEAVAGGARRLAGGERVGAVVPPTLLSGVDSAMSVTCKEVFGPVMSLAPFDDLNEAIATVNATPYGLATGLFTNRLDAAFDAARRLEVGGVHINETSSSRVDMMPYGGSKDSGFGREGPRYAIREMSEEKMITLRP